MSKFIFNLIGLIYIETAENYIYFFKYLINSICYKVRNMQNSLYFLKSFFYSLYESDKINLSTIGIIFYTIISDIEITIHNVCNKIFYDNSVSKEDRIKRAQGLIFIGNIFIDTNLIYEDVVLFLKNKIDIML